MNEKPKMQKSCLNCFHLLHINVGKDAFCKENNRIMPAPDSIDDPDYGYCSDYVYECYMCVHECCPKTLKTLNLYNTERAVPRRPRTELVDRA